MSWRLWKCNLKSLHLRGTRGAVEREREGYMGNYGPQMREIFQDIMIVVVKKWREELLVLQIGSRNQISDHVLQKSGQESKIKCLQDVQWLIDDRAEQWRGSADSRINSCSSGANCTAVNKMLMAIANLKNAEIFHEFVSKIILSSNNIKASDVQYGLGECVRNSPFWSNEGKCHEDYENAI